MLAGSVNSFPLLSNSFMVTHFLSLFFFHFLKTEHLVQRSHTVIIFKYSVNISADKILGQQASVCENHEACRQHVQQTESIGPNKSVFLRKDQWFLISFSPSQIKPV